jgi:hypothetical protein
MQSFFLKAILCLNIDIFSAIARQALVQPAFLKAKTDLNRKETSFSEFFSESRSSVMNSKIKMRKASWHVKIFNTFRRISLSKDFLLTLTRHKCFGTLKVEIATLPVEKRKSIFLAKLTMREKKTSLNFHF